MHPPCLDCSASLSYCIVGIKSVYAHANEEFKILQDQTAGSLELTSFNY